MDYDNTNRGAIFKNEKTKDTQPDYTGKLNVGGREFRVASWIKQSKQGTNFMSLSVEPWEDKGQQSQQPQQAAPISSNDIPF